MRFRNLISN